MRLIDADALMARLEERKDPFVSIGYLAGLCKAQEYIDEAPTVEPNRWIPCSERLPEEWRDVLLSFDKSITEWTNVGYMFRDEETFEYWFQSDGMSYKKDDVLAWMPLPEAYEEDD